jgi:hypothetical protein
MVSLIIGNSRTRDMVGKIALLTSGEREHAGYAALRVLWFAKAGDIVVLPWLPRAEYLAYVTSRTRTDADSLTLLAPPPGIDGEDLLTQDRMADPGFREHLRATVQERRVDDVLAVYADVAVVDLVDAVGLAGALPGRPFSAARGTSLINSKAVFRALAAGVGVAVAPGHVVTEPDEAVRAVSRLFADGHSAMLKKEFQCGGHGNEIVSATDGVRPAGSSRVVVLSNDTAIADYIAERWDWLTVGGRDGLVVERYLPGCDTVYAEYLIRDEGPELVGTGQILMEPVAVGEVVPALPLSKATHAGLVNEGGRLCQCVHTMGYRGYLSTDAILTPTGDVVFTETNGRMSGSTHLHRVVRERLLTEAQRPDRVLLERRGWTVPSFAAADRWLTRSDLNFDPVTGTGVLLTSDHLPDGTVTYCVVAPDLAAATAVARRLVSSAGDMDVAWTVSRASGGTL